MIDFSKSNIILASQSPRRQELLSGMDIPFTLSQPFEVDETPPAEVALKDVALYLARLKSEQYPHVLQKGDILITADTVVMSANKIMGKPTYDNDAVKMLNELSGKRHEVITGVCVRSSSKKIVFDETSYVTFAPMQKDEIEYYVSKYKPADKAGAYGIQEWIGYIGVEYVEGSFYNVMGLPTQRLYTELKYIIG